jgi:SAM-dependent methyltransferase
MEKTIAPGPTRQAWQVAGDGADAYERYLVPVFFTPCAAALLDAVAPRAGEHVVDVACGTGAVSRDALARVRPDGTVAGADINDGMLAVARAAAPGTDFRRADAERLPWPDAVADVALCQQGLQFVANPAAALAELHRVLRPGGRLGVAVWRDLPHSTIFGPLVTVLDRHIGAEAAATMRSPFAGPSGERLRDLAAAAGFTDLRLRIAVVTARFPSAEDFLWREVASSPLAGPVGALDDPARAALERAVVDLARPYADDDGITFTIQTWLLTGRAGRAA